MELLNKQQNCLNCRTYFIENQELPLQDITTEFKYYDLPIKQSKPKFTILKTIVAFLNTKGGTIFFGVEDQKCTVKGNIISKKHQDQFKFFIKDLTSRVHPKLDYSNKPEVQTFFVPILNSHKNFIGKYVVKILVSQGSRDIVYTFAEKIKITSQKGDLEEFQIRNSFRRISAGGVQSLKPLEILEQVYRKAKNPNQQYKIHENCNPKPLEPFLLMKTICFKKIDKQSKKRLLQIFESFLEDSPMNHEVQYNQESKKLKIIFEQIDDAQEVKDTIIDNIVYFKTDEFSLDYEGEQLDSFIFVKKSKKNVEISEQKKQKQKPIMTTKKIQQQKKLKAEKINVVTHKNSQKMYIYAVTHINTRIADKLYNYLNSLFSKKQFVFQQYVNTIIIKTSFEEDLKDIQKIIQKNINQLRSYGHSKKIISGIISGHIHIYNYFQKKRENLKSYVNQLLNGGIKNIQFRKDDHDKTRSYMDITFEDDQVAFALDTLLLDEDIRQFRIYDKDRDVPKMKFMLICK